MVMRRRSWGLVCGTVALAGSCQALVGIEDKQLDPGYGKDSGVGGSAGTSGDAGASGGPTGNDPVPPSRPPGAATPGGGATRWFAVRTMYLGTVDPKTGKSDYEAWRAIGHDIDGECTTAEISKSDSSSTCSKPPNASAASLEDGDDCRDNAAGKLLAAGAQQLATSFEAGVNADLETAESPTYLLRLDDLGDGADDPYVRGAIYVTVARDPATTKAPTWVGEDQFVVDVTTVDVGDGGQGDAGVVDGGAKDAAVDAPVSQNPLIDKPRYVFDKGYMTGNVWVSGDFLNTPKTLPLFVLDRISVIDLPTVTLVAGLSPEHDRILASQMSAVVPTTVLEQKFRPVALEIVNCVSFLGDTLMNNFILPGRDLGSNPPTFKTPKVPCDAESLGFAFRWEPVKPPVFVAAGASKPFVCGG
jgi:hypothetical protein